MALFLEESSAFSNAFSQLAGKSVVVLGHRRPDGDCIGSQVALTRVLLSQGIDARAVNADPIPRTLQKFVGDTPFFRPDEVGGDDFVVGDGRLALITSGWGMSLPLDFRISS